MYTVPDACFKCRVERGQSVVALGRLLNPNQRSLPRCMDAKRDCEFNCERRPMTPYRGGQERVPQRQRMLASLCAKKIVCRGPPFFSRARTAKAGVLTVRLPLREEAKPNKIKVAVAA